MNEFSSTNVQAPGQQLLINIFPLFLVFIFILIGHVSFGLEITTHLDPTLFLVPAFFLAIHSKRNLTPVLIMLLGLFKDIIDGTPFGFWGVLITFFYFAAHGQQQVLLRAEFRGRWLGYAAVSFLTFLIAYLIAAVRDDMLSLFWLSMASAGLSALWFPPISILLGMLIIDEQE